VDRGNSVIIVRRQDDGSWKIARLITHGDQPPISSKQSVFCPDKGPFLDASEAGPSAPGVVVLGWLERLPA